jgi:hypothetical protein
MRLLVFRRLAGVSLSLVESTEWSPNEKHNGDEYELYARSGRPDRVPIVHGVIHEHPDTDRAEYHPGYITRNVCGLRHARRGHPPPRSLWCSPTSQQRAGD